MVWYIESWAVLDGIAFASEREPGTIDAAQTVRLAVPELRAEPVGSIATALWPARGHFQEGLYGPSGEEIPFEDLDQIAELVRRGFLGGGDGGGPAGVPVEPPLRPSPEGPIEEDSNYPRPIWPDGLGKDEPKNGVEAFRLFRSALLDGSTPIASPLTKAAAKTFLFERSAREKWLTRLVLGNVALRTEDRDLRGADLSSWLTLMYVIDGAMRDDDYEDTIKWLAGLIPEVEAWILRSFPWPPRFRRWWHTAPIPESCLDGLFFRSPLGAVGAGPDTVGELLLRCCSDRDFVEELTSDQAILLILAARAVVVGAGQEFRFRDRDEVLEASLDWLTRSLPKRDGIPQDAAKALHLFFEQVRER